MFVEVLLIFCWLNLVEVQGGNDDIAKGEETGPPKECLLCLIGPEALLGSVLRLINKRSGERARRNNGELGSALLGREKHLEPGADKQGDDNVGVDGGWVEVLVEESVNLFLCKMKD